MINLSENNFDLDRYINLVEKHNRLQETEKLLIFQNEREYQELVSLTIKTRNYITE